MNWGELVLEVDDVITEMGQPITITSVTQGTYDPALGKSTDTVKNITSIGVLFDYGDQDINGTTIMRGDKKLLVKPSGLTSVTTNDTVLIGTTRYHIVSVTQTNPAGTNLLYELGIRGTA